MSSNPYTNYYVNQAGSGISGFQGVRFQRGQGFFGNIFKSAILPLLKYLGPKILNTGASIASDAIEGENVMSSLKKRGKAAAMQMSGDVANRALKFAQTGKGRKRRRKTNKIIRKRTKRIKRVTNVRRKSRKRSKAKSVFS